MMLNEEHSSGIASAKYSGSVCRRERSRERLSLLTREELSSTQSSNQAVKFDFSDQFLHRVKMIATDMDGTFFAPGLTVLASTLQAYARARNSGLLLVPATGRSRDGVIGTLKHRSLDAQINVHPGVYLNGVSTFGSNGTLLIEERLSLEVVQLLCAFVDRVRREVRTLDPAWFSRDVYTQENISHGFPSVRNRALPLEFVSFVGYSQNNPDLVVDRLDQLADGLNQFREGPVKEVGPLSEYVRRAYQGLRQTAETAGVAPESSVTAMGHIAKALLVFHTGEDAARFRSLLDETLAGRATIAAGVPRIVEVCPNGITKDVGLLAVCKSLGVIMSEVFALGDGENDVEMLKAAGYSVAMGNASAAAISAADALTSRHVDGGWAQAVNALLDARERVVGVSYSNCYSAEK